MQKVINNKQTKSGDTKIYRRILLKILSIRTPFIMYYLKNAFVRKTYNKSVKNQDKQDVGVDGLEKLKRSGMLELKILRKEVSS
jgi:hypothetical protein